MSCKEGCKGRIIDAEKGIYCYCIEKNLPHLHRRSFPAYRVRNIDLLSDSKLWKSVTGEERQELEDYLYSRGLEEYEVEIIVERYVDGDTFKQLSENQGWVSERAARYRLQVALTKLRHSKTKRKA